MGSCPADAVDAVGIDGTRAGEGIGVGRGGRPHARCPFLIGRPSGRRTRCQHAAARRDEGPPVLSPPHQPHPYRLPRGQVGHRRTSGSTEAGRAARSARGGPGPLTANRRRRRHRQRGSRLSPRPVRPTGPRRRHHVVSSSVTQLPLWTLPETLYGVPRIDWMRTGVKRRRAIFHPPETRTRTSS